ncbi:MAG: hypothetical protein HKL84_06695, partial [Acidimicrobiaceae bacterium]|nr:hypothetical protein [Acidimicrobiaceae bacterium]
PSELRELKKIRSNQLDVLTETILTKVKGTSKDILVSFLEARGTIDQAIRRTRRFGYLGRCRAASFLGNLGVPQAREPLEKLLRDRKRDVRMIAARGLGQLGDPSSIPSLFKAIESKKRVVPFGTVLVALMRMGPAGKPLIRSGLSAKGELVRAASAEILGLLGAVEYTSDLIDHLEQDPSVDIQIRCARALGRIGSPRALAPLRNSLQKQMPRGLRMISCGALASIGGNEVIDEIAQLVNEEDTQLARASAHAASQMGPKGIQVLWRLIDTDSPGALIAREELARTAVKSSNVEEDIRGYDTWTHFL